MPEPASTRLGLIGPTGSTDDISLGDDIINAIIAQLDEVGAAFLQGASRPSASTALKGFFYVHTDTGLVSYCTGSAWLDVQPYDSDLALYAAATAPGAQLGLNDGTSVRRGKSIIATSESRLSNAYGLLTTPDRVQNIVLPTDGLICVAYQATWFHGTDPKLMRAAIFVGANQLKMQPATASNTPVLMAAGVDTGTSANREAVLASWAGGLCTTAPGPTGTGDVTTGQAIGITSYQGAAGYVSYEVNGTVLTSPSFQTSVGGPCCIFAAAGTYDVSVQFKTTDGSAVNAKNRKLWVWTLGF